MPSLALYTRNPVNYSDVMLFVYAPVWTMAAFWYGDHMTSFGLFPNLLLLLIGDPEVYMGGFYFFITWLALVVSLWILRRRPNRTRVVEATIVLNAASSLLWGLVLIVQVAQCGTSGLGYPLPFPILPLIGFYILRRWRTSSPSVVSGEIECPFCRNRFTTGPEGVHIGETVGCPKCGKTLKVTA